MLRHKEMLIAIMIPIEYLWYIIGAIAVPVFIKIYLKSLKRNREDKERVAMRRKRFEGMMKSPSKASGKSATLKRSKTPAPVPQTATERIAKDRATDRAPVEAAAKEHWLLNAKKLPTKKEQPRPTSPPAGHWLENVKPKRKHWLYYLKR